MPSNPKTHFIFVLLGILTSLTPLAQTLKPNASNTFEIVSEYQSTMRESSKIKFNPSELKMPVDSTKLYPYTYEQNPQALSLSLPLISPLHYDLFQLAKQKTTPHFIQASFGSQSHLQAEAIIGIINKDDNKLNVFGNYEMLKGSEAYQEKRNIEAGIHANVDLSSSYQLNALFQYRNSNAYSNNEYIVNTPPSAKSAFNLSQQQIQTKLELIRIGSADNKFNMHLGVGVQYASSNSIYTETAPEGRGDASYRLNDEIQLGMSAYVQAIELKSSFNGSISTLKTFQPITLTPHINFNYERFKTQVGLSYNSLGSTTEYTPSLNFIYLLPSISKNAPYLFFTVKQEFLTNSYASFATQNPWFYSGNYANYSKQTQIVLGWKLMLLQCIEYQARLKWEQAEDLPFFVNDYINENVFKIANESRLTSLINEHVFNYTISNHFKSVLSVNLRNVLEEKTFSKPLLLPLVKLNAQTSYTWNKRNEVNLGIDYFNQSYYLNTDNSIKDMPSVFLLNLGFERALTPQKTWMLWIKVNNILNQQTPLLATYNQIGFNASIGLKLYINFK